jgi:hypothetical protein
MSKKPVFTRTVDENGKIFIDCHLLPHQRDARKSTKQISGIVGGRGCGKSIFLSVMAVEEMVHGGKVILFAQDFGALMKTMFKEILERFRECGLNPQTNLQNKTIKIGNGELFGYSYENIESVRGLSNCSMLILDEFAVAPINILETASPCLRGSVRPKRIIFGTTPRKGSIWNKWFRDTTVDKDVFTATMYDNTELDEEDYKIQEKAIKDENAFKQEILGTILDDDVEFGIIKQIDYPTIKKQPFGIHTMGIDCAGSGGDYNVFVVADNSSILEIVREQVADTYKLYNIANNLIQKYDVRRVNVDATGGFGNGIVDMLHHNKSGLIVNPINFGQKPKEDVYVNARAEMYFNLANKIREGFYIEDDKVKEELQYTTYQINGSGKTLLVPKDNIRELIGRSPDTSDALALALYDMGTMSPQESLDIAFNFSSFQI